MTGSPSEQATPAPGAEPDPGASDPVTAGPPGASDLSEDALLRLAGRLQEVPGIAAVALGGSRARGTHHPESDVDLGLYYDAAGLDLEDLRTAVREIGGAGASLAGPGQWGPWVDGGAWLRIDGQAVDLILREVDRVGAQRDRAIRGELEVHTQIGHPLGFLDITYAAEVATCRPLADPYGVIAALRTGLDPYPAALRHALVDRLWASAFQVDGAAKAAPRGDTAYVQLCCSHALLWCAHAWHADAGVWVTNEKGLLPALAALGPEAAEFAAEAETALGSSTPTAMVRRTRALVTRTMTALT